MDFFHEKQIDIFKWIRVANVAAAFETLLFLKDGAR